MYIDTDTYGWALTGLPHHSFRLHVYLELLGPKVMGSSYMMSLHPRFYWNYCSSLEVYCQLPKPALVGFKGIPT